MGSPNRLSPTLFFAAHAALCSAVSLAITLMHEFGPHNVAHNLLDAQVALVVPVMFAAYLFDRKTYLAALTLSGVSTLTTVRLVRSFEAPTDFIIIGVVLAICAASSEAIHRAVQARRQAQDESIRAKTMFVAKMSHEIRTPLTAIIGSVELMSAKSVPPHLREHMETIEAAGESILRLIDDIIDYTRIEAGRLEIRSEPLELRNAVDMVRRVIEPKAKAKHLSLAVDVDRAPPGWVTGDALRVQQVLTNLLTNAVKFSRRGQIRLTAARTGGSDPDAVLFTVSDEGPGIPREEQEAIFHTFTRVGATAADPSSGAGLGLAITKGLVEAMNGRLSIDSETGQGCRFEVSLPMPAADPPADPEKKKHETEFLRKALASGPPPSVLLVDDNALNRRIAQHMLASFGCRVTMAENGRQAVDSARQERFDVIFMDIQMPVMDGFQAVRAIREDEGETRRTVIYAMTAHAMESDRRQCLEAGMDGHLAKPIKLDELRRAVAQARGRPTAG